MALSKGLPKKKHAFKNELKCPSPTFHTLACLSFKLLQTNWPVKLFACKHTMKDHVVMTLLDEFQYSSSQLGAFHYPSVFLTLFRAGQWSVRGLPSLAEI